MGWKERPKRSKQEKRKSARKGAIVFSLVTAGALTATISTGSCADESYRRGNLMTLATGDASYGRTRSTPCGVVRLLAPDQVDAVPCQIWNLLPLTIVGAASVVWLLLDRAGLDRRYRD